MQLLAAPRWVATRRLMRSGAVLLPLGLAYGLLLAWSWRPDTFSILMPGSWADGLRGAPSGRRRAAVVQAGASLGAGAGPAEAHEHVRRLRSPPLL